MNSAAKVIALLFVLMLTTSLFSGRADAASGKKTLVVYFSRTGTTKKAAEQIQKLTGADIVRLKTRKEYPSDYDEMLDIAQEEQDSDARPELATQITGFKKYDTILLGYPIWWGEQPMAINTFLESYDFSGKKIIPFCTSGGSGISASVRSMKKICKTASFGTGLDVTDAGKSRLQKWLQNNGVSLVGASSEVTIKIGKKDVTKQTCSLTKGEKATLKVSVSGWSGEKKITYKSSDKKTVSVTSKGVVKALKTGTAKIKVTVKSGKKSVTAWVKIKVVKENTAEPEQTDETGADTGMPDTNVPDSSRPDTNAPDTDMPGGDKSDADTPAADPDDDKTNTDTPDADSDDDKTSTDTPGGADPDDDKTDKPSEDGSDTDTPSGGAANILVAYFSCTGTTKPLAEYAAEYLNADLYEIRPEVPYTSADLNYSNSSSRATREQNDPQARPAISGRVENMAQYSTVVLAYPIWWGQAPRIISTFLESYDFGGKTIVPFCTSGSSPIGSSASSLHSLTDSSTQWKSGRRFAGGTSRETIIQWLNGEGIKPTN